MIVQTMGAPWRRSVDIGGYRLVRWEGFVRRVIRISTCMGEKTMRECFRTEDFRGPVETSRSYDLGAFGDCTLNPHLASGLLQVHTTTN